MTINPDDIIAIINNAPKTGLTTYQQMAIDEYLVQERMALSTSTEDVVKYIESRKAKPQSQSQAAKPEPKPIPPVEKSQVPKAEPIPTAKNAAPIKRNLSESKEKEKPKKSKR